MKNRVSLMKNQAPPQTTHPPEYDHLADVAVVGPLVSMEHTEGAGDL